jgi:hypothetical protein
MSTQNLDKAVKSFIRNKEELKEVKEEVKKLTKEKKKLEEDICKMMKKLAITSYAAETGVIQYKIKESVEVGKEGEEPEEGGNA